MKKQLKRLSLFLMILLITNPIFSQNKDEVITELKNRLEKSNEVIEKLVDKVEEKDEKIEELEEENGSLRKEVKNLTERLKVSNNTIDDLVKRIEADQKEIKKLRKSIDDTSDYVSKTKNFIAGVNINYPLGGGGLFGFNFDSFPIGIYTTFNINRDLNITNSIGISYRF